MFIVITTSSTVGVTVFVIVIVVTATGVTFYWMKKKRNQQYESGTQGKKVSGYNLILFYTVDHQAITYNPAYVEGKVYCLHTSYTIIIIHYSEHIGDEK